MSSLQELVDRGQFAAASVLLESGPPGPINSVTRQLALQNNRAVLGFLQVMVHVWLVTDWNISCQNDRN